MKTGLAAWHYPHRTIDENVRFFFDHGFDYVSLLGMYTVKALRDPAARQKLTDAVTGHTVTVHHTLPETHSAEEVAKFKADIDTFAAWQKEAGIVAILSFDVPQDIRPHIASYVSYVLEQMPTDTRIAVEDYGLTEEELADLTALKEEKRFGFLIDIGHMFIRFGGQNRSGKTLFTRSAEEKSEISTAGFAETIRNKPFPTFELHLHNNDGTDDLHHFLDDGTLDMGMIAAALNEIGFDGLVTIESAPGFRFKCFGDDADRGILHDLELWNSLRKQG